METNVKTYYPTIKQSFGLLVKLFLISIPASIPLIILMIFAGNVLEKNLIKSIGYLIAYVIALTWVIRRTKKKIEKRDLRKFTWRKKSLSLSMMTLIFLMTLALMVGLDLFEFIPFPKFMTDMLKDLIQPDIYSFLAAVIFAPVLEELLFRGIILEGFLHNYSPKKAILWSALIFGIAHANPLQFLNAFFAGLFIGWIYFKTRSLIPGIMIHFINNLINFLIMVISGNQDTSLINIVGNTYLYLILIFLSMLLLIFGIKYINKKTKNVPEVDKIPVL